MNSATSTAGLSRPAGGRRPRPGPADSWSRRTRSARRGDSPAAAIARVSSRPSSMTARRIFAGVAGAEELGMGASRGPASRGRQRAGRRSGRRRRARRESARWASAARSTVRSRCAEHILIRAGQDLDEIAARRADRPVAAHEHTRGQRRGCLLAGHQIVGEVRRRPRRRPAGRSRCTARASSGGSGRPRARRVPTAAADVELAVPRRRVHGGIGRRSRARGRGGRRSRSSDPGVRRRGTGAGVSRRPARRSRSARAPISARPSAAVAVGAVACLLRRLGDETGCNERTHAEPTVRRDGAHQLARFDARCSGTASRAAEDTERDRPLATARAPRRVRIASICPVPRHIVPTGDAFQAAMRSRIRSRGPTSATSSTSLSGTAAIASLRLPARNASWIRTAASS